MLANCLYERGHSVVVGDGALAYVLDSVCHSSGVDKLIDVRCDERCVLSYLLDERDVVGRELAGLLGTEDIEHLVNAVDELTLVARGHGHDVVDAEVAEDARLDLDFLSVGVPLDLVAGLQFLTLENVRACEHLYALVVEISVDDEGHRAFSVEAAACGFLLPLLAVAVAVEANGSAGCNVLTY